MIYVRRLPDLAVELSMLGLALGLGQLGWRLVFFGLLDFFLSHVSARHASGGVEAHRPWLPSRRSPRRLRRALFAVAWCLDVFCEQEASTSQVPKIAFGG
jgi:hypothetical protein